MRGRHTNVKADMQAARVAALCWSCVLALGLLLQANGSDRRTERERENQRVHEQ